jgi:hypothetical protein
VLDLLEAAGSAPSPIKGCARLTVR